MFALLLALACGCSSEEGAGGEVPANATQVSFILSLSESSAGTRVQWDGDDVVNPSDEEYERRIDPAQLHAALYGADNNTLAATVKILSHHKTATEGEYEFIGTVEAASDVTLTPGSYKLMVFANCEEPSYDDPSNLTYTYEDADVRAEKQLIPMWGVTTASLQFEKGEREDMGTISLLRAFAKVEINLHSDIAGTYEISSAKLTQYNQQGYCLPAGYASVSNTVELDQENDTYPSFHPYSSASTDLYFSYSEDKKSACLYIPEYENSTNAATISLQLSDGTNETTGTLHFQPYDAKGALTGAPYDIVRNHIYRYTVNVEQGELKVQAAVMPWQLVTSSIGWKPQPITDIPDPFEGKTDYENMLKGNYYMLFPRVEYEDYSVDEGDYQTRKMFDDLYDHPQKGDDEAVKCFVCRPGYVTRSDAEQKLLKTGSGGARYYFMLTGPEGATWEAHLTNTKDFSFSTTYEEDEFMGSEYEQGIFKVTHGIARKKPYIIQIVANNNYTGSEVGQTGTDPNIPKYPTNNNEGGKEYFGDEYLTDWGADKWYGQKVVDTEFYITVKLTDGTEYELEINPSFEGKDEKNLKESSFFYKDYRRYAGTGTRIWIRQLRAVYESDYIEMAKDVSPTSIGNKDPKDDFQWWRVNPYWNPKWKKP